MRNKLSAFSVMISLTLLFLLSFTVTAFAAGASLSPDASLLDLAAPVFDAVKNGNGWLAAFGSVMLLVAAARKYLPDSYGGKFVRSDLGGIVTAFLFSFGGAGATVLAAGAAMSGAVALTAVKVALAAVGGFQVIHKLAGALTATSWYATKAPAWFKAGLGFVLGLIGSNAVKKAEAAGDAAVKAQPSTGLAGVTGPGEDL